jgi:hypothetical protein
MNERVGRWRREIEDGEQKDKEGTKERDGGVYVWPSLPELKVSSR